MRYILAFVFLLMSCSLPEYTPVSYIIDCATDQQQEDAYNKYVEIIKFYDGVKKKYKHRCLYRTINFGRPYCINFVEYLILIDNEVLRRELIYNDTKKCHIIKR